MIRGALIILTMAGLSTFTAGAQTASVTLAWTLSSSTNVTGYDIYYGTVSSNYTSSMTVSNVPEATIQGLTNGTTYYFAARTFNSSGYLSIFSPQISHVASTSAVPAAITSPLASPSGQFSFSVSGTSGYQYMVEASTNLVNWVILGTNTAPFNFVDTNASQFSRRFYRAVYDPGTNATSSSITTTTPAAGQLTSTSVKTAGQFSFTVTGTAGDPYAVEASTNLVNWIVLTTNTVPFNFVDTNASHFSRRFYRAVPAQYAAATSTATTTPSPAPTITASSVNAAGHFGFMVSGISGYKYVVKASTDLVNWTILEIKAAPFNFVDTNSVKYSRRYYRAVYFPN